MKKLDFFVGVLNDAILSIDNPGNPEINRVTDDSRQVEQGDIFVAVVGVNNNGSKYIYSAIEKGASTIVYQTDYKVELPANVCGIEVNNSRLALALLQKAYFDRPDEKLKMFGVTGTNGKTTTVYLLRTILERLNHPCGLISTVEVASNKRTVPATHTTPDAQHLYEILSEFVEDNLECCAIEISSHSLTQYRCGGIRFKSAIFTNLTGDHLDYHHDMEHYFQAKERLFKEYLKLSSIAVVNIDDNYGKRLFNGLKERKLSSAVSFGVDQEADYRISKLKISAVKSEFSIKTQNLCCDFKTNLIGKHNVYNLCGVIVALFSAKMASLEELSSVINSCEFKIPGRLEKVSLPNGATVFVDYAHTDDALRNVLNIVRAVTKNKLTLIFGCGGDRDRTKRPRMGAVAAELADNIVITSDNPRSEEPEAIISEIITGIPKTIPYNVEPDREKAIRKAIGQSVEGDVILIAGKGHEDYQEIKGERHYFSDLELVNRLFTE